MIFSNRCLEHMGYIGDLADQVADTVDNIPIIDGCCMSSILDNGSRSHQVLTKWVQNVELLSHGGADRNDALSGPPEPSAKSASICALATLLRTTYLAKSKSCSEGKGLQGSSVMVLFSHV